MCALAFVAGPTAAQTYKWKDADGKMHYSDQPPPAGAKDEVTVKRKPGAVPPAAAADPKDKGAAGAGKAPTYQEQEAAFRKRQVEAAEKEAAEKKKADELAEKKRNCEQARAQVATMQAGGRVTRVNAKGEKEYLSDSDIAQEVDRAKKAADTWCK